MEGKTFLGRNKRSVPYVLRGLMLAWSTKNRYIPESFILLLMSDELDSIVLNDESQTFHDFKTAI